MNNLITYFRERINFPMWIILSLLLYWLGAGDVHTDYRSIGVVILISVFLITMRLFDDLFSFKLDSKKENRSYTDRDVQKSLIIYVIISMIGLSAVTIVIEHHIGAALVSYFVGNFVLYLLLFKFEFFRFLLPLVKYAFVAALLMEELTVLPLALLAMFVLFELIDDNKSNVIVKMALLTAAYLLLVSISNFSEDLILHVVAYTASAILLFFNWKFIPYFIIILFFTIRIII
ncbi:MAG: hypothetical protein ACJAZ2_000742 [Glaciecola sp.]|jgi:hypothetical protein